MSKPESPASQPLISHQGGPAWTGSGYRLPEYEFKVPNEMRDPSHKAQVPVIIAGAGLAGLTLACDLALRGIKVIVIDDDNTVGVRGASSRGICYAQKSLEIFKRLGIYDRIAAKGVRWSVGKTLAGSDVIYSFDLARQTTHSASTLPPFINLQQFYLEWFLVERLAELPEAEIRWKSRVVNVSQNDAQVVCRVECPAGIYEIEADWLVDATGARSPIRDRLGLKTHAALGEDRWCISDVRFKHKPPIERWTWVEAPFNENRAVWQHLMADDVWRLDYQMAPDSDPAEISKPEVVAQRLAAQFGPDVDFELVWVGPYSYRSYVIDEFQHGRIFFVGDSAHVMSPFGARGGNSAIQDADNLGWKLARVIKGTSSPDLLASYHEERHLAARRNVEITNRTMRFLTPKPGMQRVFREAVIQLARKFAFAQTLVNTGRLSSPTDYGSGSGPIQGQSIANCKMLDPAGSPSDLLSLLQAHDALKGEIIVLAQGREQAAACRLAIGDQPSIVVIALGEPGLWTDPDGYLHRHFSCSCSEVMVLRPDLHSAGAVAISALATHLSRLFCIDLLSDQQLRA